LFGYFPMAMFTVLEPMAMFYSFGTVDYFSGL